MIFFFKKKITVVDCFTSNKSAYEIFKPDYAHQFFPDWWKTLPKTVSRTISSKTDNNEEMTTIKNCPGILDYYKHGFILPLWCDHLFEVGKLNTDYLKVVPSDPRSNSSKHPVAQRGGYLPENRYTHIKLDSPWFLKSNKQTHFLWTKPTWNFENPNEFIQPSAVIEFYYQNATNVNMFFERKPETYKLVLAAGTPIAHFIPLSEDKIRLQYHLISDLELNHIKLQNNNRFSFERSYIKYVRYRNKQKD